MAEQSGIPKKFWSSWLKIILSIVGTVMLIVPSSEIRRSARRGGSQYKDKGARSKRDDNLQLRVLIFQLGRVSSMPGRLVEEFQSRELKLLLLGAE